MSIWTNVIKKASATVLLSGCIISALVTPAFAGGDVISLDNKVSNELPAEFTVMDAVVDEVVLSWDITGSDLDTESYNLTKDEVKKVTYYVNPKSTNQNDLQVNVLLKVPDASATAIGDLKVDGNTISSSFMEAGFTYYAVKDGLLVATDSGVYTGTFDIAFNETSAKETPFEASLIAVQEAAAASSITVSTTNASEAPGTRGVYLTFKSDDAVKDGILTINLGDGFASLGMSDGKYGAYFVDTQSFDITEEHYNPDTKVLTLPIASNALLGQDHLIFLNPATITDVEGVYDINYTMDSDGEGTAFTPTSGELILIVSSKKE